MIHGKNFSISQLKVIGEHMMTFKKIAISQGDDYRIGCLLDYNCFN